MVMDRGIPFINQKPMTAEAARFYAARSRETAKRCRREGRTIDATLFDNQASRLEAWAAGLVDES